MLVGICNRSFTLSGPPASAEAQSPRPVRDDRMLASGCDQRVDTGLDGCYPIAAALTGDRRDRRQTILRDWRDEFIDSDARA